MAQQHLLMLSHDPFPQRRLWLRGWSLEKFLQDSIASQTRLLTYVQTPGTLLSHLETALLLTTETSVISLFPQLKLQSIHILSHFSLSRRMPILSFLVLYMWEMPWQICLPAPLFAQCKEHHKDHAPLHHRSTSSLQAEFHIPHEDAHAIIRDCSTWPVPFHPLPMGLNP